MLPLNYRGPSCRLVVFRCVTRGKRKLSVRKGIFALLLSGFSALFILFTVGTSLQGQLLSHVKDEKRAKYEPKYILFLVLKYDLPKHSFLFSMFLSEITINPPSEFKLHYLCHHLSSAWSQSCFTFLFSFCDSECLV